MIEFLTLLLGLVSGVQTVEVRTATPVAQVEILLDGGLEATADTPPWRFTVDLGEDLAPHTLTAVARDESGRELGRTQQSLNLPRGSAEARWVLENGAEGHPAVASLIWEQVWSAAPLRIDVRFDGQPLDLAAGSKVRLPRYDPTELHFLSAELTFPEDVQARADVSFGGRFGDRVESELTAVPIVFSGPHPPRAQDMEGRFRHRDSALHVVAVEEGGADVVVVRDAAAQQWLAHQIGEVESRYRRRFHRGPRDLLPLGQDARVRFVWPSLSAIASDEGRRIHLDQFAEPQRFEASSYGLSWLLTRTTPPPVPQRIADAVALAGLAAAGGDRPRAVVLVLGGSTEDRSRYSPSLVRRYLQRLRVPLFVWSLSTDPPGGWGDAEPVGDWPELQDSVRRLRGGLESQAVVWLQGRYLPQEIELVSAGDGLRWPAGGAGALFAP